MKSKDNEQQQIVSSVQNELDKSCDRLDGQILSRLNTIRNDALEKSKEAQAKRFFLAPFAGLVTACLVLVMVSFWNQHTSLPIPNTNSSALEDLDILISTDNIEFYEDFEFYQWLAENESSV